MFGCMAIRDFPLHPPPSSSPSGYHGNFRGQLSPVGNHPPLSSSPYGCHGNSHWQAIGFELSYRSTLPWDPPPTRPQLIPALHNTQSSWLHPDYKNWAAISQVWLLRPCSLGMVNLAWERALNKACLKPACFVIWLQFGLPIRINLTGINKKWDEYAGYWTSLIYFWNITLPELFKHLHKHL
jgi:hypothetical protein